MTDSILQNPSHSGIGSSAVFRQVPTSSCMAMLNKQNGNALKYQADG
jgi:hypothetical protein